ncbi:MAG: helix-turn-helix domain-containing protein [Flavobacteriales bacterium]|nr:helix-turn-helix domain-containing protein [Flavobacteriales bacterium]
MNKPAFDIENDPIYTIEQTAAKLNMSKSSFEKLRKDGGGPIPISNGGLRVLFNSSAITNYVIKLNPHLNNADKVLAAAADARAKALKLNPTTNHPAAIKAELEALIVKAQQVCTGNA